MVVQSRVRVRQEMNAEGSAVIGIGSKQGGTRFFSRSIANDRLPANAKDGKANLDDMIVFKFDSGIGWNLGKLHVRLVQLRLIPSEGF